MSGLGVQKSFGNQGRVPGIDSVRFVSALWVAVEHIGLPGAVTMERGPLRGALSVMFGAGAAVAVFFVLSGFVIHYPHRRADRVDLLPFYARRHIRILVPAVAVLSFSAMIGVPPEQLVYGVLWTLACEEVYYTIYPLVHRLARRAGWTWLVVASIPPSLLLAAHFQSRGMDYHRYPWSLSWLVSWPLWLLGARLADRIDEHAVVTDRAPWGWRVAVAGMGSILMALHFHTQLSYGYSLKAFGFLVVPWLAREIGYARAGHRAAALEWLGGLSYSLYLIHLPIALVLGRGKPLTYLVVGLATLVFWAAIERPSHRLARRFASWLVESRSRMATVDVSN